MRRIATLAFVLMAPGLSTNADYKAPPSSWHKPLPSFENRRIRLVPQPHPETPISQEERIERSRSVFIALHGLGNYIGKQQMRLQLLDALLEDAQMPQFAKKILTQISFAREAFGEEQAIARIYSVELLARTADMGDTIPLFETAKELTLMLSNKEDLAKGELRDLEDLLFEYLRRSDLSDVQRVLRPFQYSTRLRETFQDAISFALKGKLTDAQIERVRDEL